MISSLEGKVILVTGAGAGIGRVTSRSLAAHGAVVAICDLDEEAGREAFEGLPGAGHRLYAGDMSLRGEVDRVVTELTADLGRLDGVHNNVGVTNAPSTIDSLSEAEWDRVIRTNLKGCWLVLRRSLAQMRKQMSGAIVNSASIAGTHAFRQLGPYCASKAGVIALTQVAAAENAQLGIRVNAVAPGMTAVGIGVTGLAKPPEDGPDPSRRYGAPEEVADAVCWLLSDQA
ncbi:MAG TPA: SDR family NAD(P)-dependent oxidoreductase, partial [Solirubrobacterales bacterium]